MNSQFPLHTTQQRLQQTTLPSTIFVKSTDNPLLRQTLQHPQQQQQQQHQQYHLPLQSTLDSDHSHSLSTSQLSSSSSGPLLTQSQFQGQLQSQTNMNKLNPASATKRPLPSLTPTQPQFINTHPQLAHLQQQNIPQGVQTIQYHQMFQSQQQQNAQQNNQQPQQQLVQMFNPSQIQFIQDPQQYQQQQTTIQPLQQQHLYHTTLPNGQNSININFPFQTPPIHLQSTQSSSSSSSGPSLSVNPSVLSQQQGGLITQNQHQPQNPTLIPLGSHPTPFTSLPTNLTQQVQFGQLNQQLHTIQGLQPTTQLTQLQPNGNNTFILPTSLPTQTQQIYTTTSLLPSSLPSTTQGVNTNSHQVISNTLPGTTGQPMNQLQQTTAFNTNYPPSYQFATQLYSNQPQTLLPTSLGNQPQSQQQQQLPQQYLIPHQSLTNYQNQNITNLNQIQLQGQTTQLPSLITNGTTQTPIVFSQVSIMPTPGTNEQNYQQLHTINTITGITSPQQLQQQQQHDDDNNINMNNQQSSTTQSSSRNQPTSAPIQLQPHHHLPKPPKIHHTPYPNIVIPQISRNSNTTKSTSTTSSTTTSSTTATLPSTVPQSSHRGVALFDTYAQLHYIPAKRNQRTSNIDLNQLPPLMIQSTPSQPFSPTLLRDGTKVIAPPHVLSYPAIHFKYNLAHIVPPHQQIQQPSTPPFVPQLPPHQQHDPSTSFPLIFAWLEDHSWPVQLKNGNAKAKIVSFTAGIRPLSQEEMYLLYHRTHYDFITRGPLDARMDYLNQANDDVINNPHGFGHGQQKHYQLNVGDNLQSRRKYGASVLNKRWSVLPNSNIYATWLAKRILANNIELPTIILFSSPTIPATINNYLTAVYRVKNGDDDQSLITLARTDPLSIPGYSELQSHAELIYATNPYMRHLKWFVSEMEILEQFLWCRKFAHEISSNTLPGLISLAKNHLAATNSSLLPTTNPSLISLDTNVQSTTTTPQVTTTDPSSSSTTTTANTSTTDTTPIDDNQPNHISIISAPKSPFSVESNNANIPSIDMDNINGNNNSSGKMSKEMMKALSIPTALLEDSKSFKSQNENNDSNSNRNDMNDASNKSTHSNQNDDVTTTTSSKPKSNSSTDDNIDTNIIKKSRHQAPTTPERSVSNNVSIAKSTNDNSGDNIGITTPTTGPLLLDAKFQDLPSEQLQTMQKLHDITNLNLNATSSSPSTAMEQLSPTTTSIIKPISNTVVTSPIKDSKAGNSDSTTLTTTSTTSTDGFSITLLNGTVITNPLDLIPTFDINTSFFFYALTILGKEREEIDLYYQTTQVRTIEIPLEFQLDSQSQPTVVDDTQQQ